MITCQKSSIKVLTDDPTITLKKFRKIRLKTTDDPTIASRFFRRTLPMIRRSQFGFFDERYRWSDDHISVFSTNATDDPMITFRFLPMIRWSHFGFYRWSDDHVLVSTDDPMIITYRRSDDHHNDWFTDDPMIILTLFTDDPMIIKNLVLLKYYRWSDDKKKGSMKVPLWSSDHR